MTAPAKLAVSVREAAQMTGISEYLVRDAINKEELLVRRAGTRIVIRVVDLETWLDKLPRRVEAS